MDRREEIIYATLELASEKGLGAVSMAQIAEKLGIKKPSLYNHFKSKDEIVSEMYRYLREQTWKKTNDIETDYAVFFKDKSLEEILLLTVSQYSHFIEDEQMLLFFKVLNSERATHPIAAQLMVEETNRMILSTKQLFYALAVHGKLKSQDIDMAALSYAMTIHSIVDYQMDCGGAKIDDSQSRTWLETYIRWFSRQMGGDCHEENND